MTTETTTTDLICKVRGVFRITPAAKPGARWSNYVPNGPQAAFDALALPTYPLTPMGLASLPGRVSQ